MTELRERESPVVIDEGWALDALGEFVWELNLDDIPDVVRRQAALSILDTVGCIAAGSLTPEARIIADAECGIGTGGASSIFGRNQLVHAESAARANAYLGDIFELNDLTGGHSSIAVVPAALALAEELGADGRALLEAVIAGVECMARVSKSYLAHTKPVIESGTAGVGVIATIAAAAAGARLLKLDKTQTIEALRLGAALANWCPIQVHFRDGGTAKPLFFGALPAGVGITAARYAKAGLGGPPGILEGEMGFLPTIATSWDPAPIRGGNGWFLATPRRKLHACCGIIHSSLDAVVDLRRQGVSFEDADLVRVAFAAYTMPLVTKGGRPPTTANEARFNAEYCLALAMTGSDVITPEHSIHFASHLERPDVQRALRKLQIWGEAAYDDFHFSRVEVFENGVARETLENRSPKGSQDNPLSPEEVRGKFRALTAEMLPEAQADAYVARVDSLAEESSVDWLITAFLQPAEGPAVR